MPWLLLLVGAGAFAAVVQTLRLRALRTDLERAGEYAELMDDLLQTAIDSSARWRGLYLTREAELEKLLEVCREVDDPDVVRARLSLLLNPNPAPVPEQRTLPLD